MPARPRAAGAGLILLSTSHSLIPGLWLASLGAALERAGLSPFWATAILSTHALAALLSPLASASFSDLRYGPVRTLGALSLAAAGLLSLASFGLGAGWSPGWLLALYLGQALAYLPTWGLLNAATFAFLGPERRHRFPLFRVWGTVGWMSAGWLVGPVFHADARPAAGLWAAGLMLAQGLVCTAVALTRRPIAQQAGGAEIERVAVIDPPSNARLGKQGGSAEEPQATWAELWGATIPALWAQAAVRRVLLNALLLAVPVAAFYPYTSRMLLDFGVEDPSSRLSWGQSTEILAMLVLVWLVRRWGEQPVLFVGALLALLRYGLFAWGWQEQDLRWVQAGITLHGAQYALFSVSIYLLLERNVASAWRARAQALLTVLTGGIGGIVGLALAGLWHSQAARFGWDWAAFWWVWAALCLPAVVLSWRFRSEPLASQTATNDK